MSDFNEIAKYIRDRVMPNDIVLTIELEQLQT